MEKPLAALARLSAACAHWVAPFILAAACLCGFYAVRHLGMDTDTAAMIASDAPWKHENDRLNRLFPQNTGLLVVVIDGASADLAEDAAAALYDALAKRPDLFLSLRRPDGGAFFAQEGLLFLPPATVQAMADSILEAQPFIAALSQDPSLRGLFSVLSLALDGVARQLADPARLEKPLAAIAGTMSAAMTGDKAPLSWQALLSPETAASQAAGQRRLILLQPKRDFAALQPGRKATDFVRQAARELELLPASGVTVRLTGPVALNDEEFGSVAEGMGLALLLSVLLVFVLLFLALRSTKLILAALVTLAAGLSFTFAFATLAVGSLNLISVAFAVMFIGIAIDFSIQFGVRLGSEGDLARTGALMAKPLAVAALAVACGFAAFIPTDYRGVSELGLIALAGMLIALLLNLTLFPALIALLRPRLARRESGLSWAGSLETLLQRRRRQVLAASAAIALAGLLLSPRLSFDFHPLHLKAESGEAMATLRDLMHDPLRSPYTIDVLAPDHTAARQLKDRLAALPEVARVIDAETFVPTEQEEKLAIIGDLKALLGLSLAPASVKPPPTDVETAAAMRQSAAKLREALPASRDAQQLARLLDQAAANPALYGELQHLLVSGLAPRLRQLSLALEAKPVSLETLPAEIRQQWIAADGSYRLSLFPAGDSNDSAVLARFVAAVRAIAPQATGPAVQIYESGEAVFASFRFAILAALGAIALLLFVVLRRPRDVLHALAPLVLAGCATVLYCLATGLSLDFANVVALPLLLGIGVAFDIYFAIEWRRGGQHLLSGPTARAILFSALTTGASFGALALSGHPGTARMGELLLIALAIELLAIFLFMPALMGKAPPRASGEVS